MKIGDNVKTNENWNRNHEPIKGKVTKIFPSGGRDMPIIEIDDGKYKINEFWLDKV